jgi:hypothetical protein
MIYLRNNEISELIRFAEINKIQTVLYSYDYYDHEDYQITEEMIEGRIEEYTGKAKRIIKKRIDEYNKFTAKLDFSRPMGLYVYCVFQGYQVGVFIKDYWIEEMDVLNAEDRFEEIEDCCDEELQKIYIEQNNKRDALKIMMKGYILSDPRFLLCTNKRLRSSYLAEIFKEKPEFNQAFPA